MKVDKRERCMTQKPVPLTAKKPPTRSKRAQSAGKQKQIEKRKRQLKTIWGDDYLTTPRWDRTKDDGWSTVPRVLPYIGRIADKLSGKGAPISQTYFALWCRAWDEGCLEIKDKEDLAYESGFSGQRAIYSLSDRIRKLRELGFIKTREKGRNEFQYIMIVDPYYVIKSHQANISHDEFRNLSLRMEDVGAVWDRHSSKPKPESGKGAEND